ncbi:hypothetical protein MKX01_031880 [Papaver californicum]|nr:hypothetical protein MKX01_031880 [Papaver californicum]
MKPKEEISKKVIRWVSRFLVTWVSYIPNTVSSDPDDEACLSKLKESYKTQTIVLEIGLQPILLTHAMVLLHILKELHVIMEEYTNSFLLTYLFLVNLVVFNLSANRLTRIILPQLSSCACLNIIDLHNNLLTGSIPQKLGGLVRLSPIPVSLGKKSGNLPKFNVTLFMGNKYVYGYSLPTLKTKCLSVIAILLV